MQPFMTSVAVIFGVNFTGPHILVVKLDLHWEKSMTSSFEHLVETSVEDFVLLVHLYD